jgi:hypothetical protein
MSISWKRSLSQAITWNSLANRQKEPAIARLISSAVPNSGERKISEYSEITSLREVIRRMNETMMPTTFSSGHDVQK